MNKGDKNTALLLVGYFLSQASGIHSVCEDLALQLSRAGWQIITTSDRTSRLGRLCDMMVTTWRQRERFSMAHVDVYSGVAFLWAEAICWLLRRLKKPYILTLHGGNLPVFAQRWPARVRSLLRTAFVVTTPSLFLKEQMAGFRSDMILLPNPLNLEHYPFRLRECPAPRLIWLRSFHHIYNPELAVKTIARLIPEIPEIHLTMLGPDRGDGSLGQVRQLIHLGGLGQQIELAGATPKSEVPKWLDKADIFINTTNIDNAPVSVLEAMACGLCVVSTNVGGISYLLEHGEDALLVQSDDVEGMADAVRRILFEAGLAERLSRNARAKAEQHDWSIVLHHWQRLFEKAMTVSKNA